MDQPASSNTSRSPQPAADRRDTLVLCLFLLAAIGFAVAAIREHARGEQTRRLAAQGLCSATPEEVIGPHPRFRGDPRAPYTLVEFGDYQCPACAACEPIVSRYVSTYGGRLSFSFRHLPLARIHPYAGLACEAAEVARAYGRFWRVHRALYGLPLTRVSRTDIIGLIRAEHLAQAFQDPGERRAAKRSCETDRRLARRLRLFLLRDNVR